MRYITNSFLATLCGLLLGLTSNARAQSSGFTWDVVDGQVVISPAKKTNGTFGTLKPGSPSTPTSLPSNYQSQGTVVDLANEAIKTAKYWTEGERAARAQAQAREAATKVLESSSARFASVPWLADRPQDISDPDNPQVYHYSIGAPKVSDDIHEVRKAIYGPLRGELNPPSGPSSSQSPGFLRGTIIAQKNPDGTISTRFANPSDARNYAKEESERIALQEAEYQKQRGLESARAQKAMDEADKRREELKQKQLAADVAKKQGDELRRQKEEAERARDAAERARKESEARAKQLAENQKALERRYQERDDACAKGRTSACIYIDDHLTNDFDTIIKHQNTARCAQFEEGAGPQGGPCAPEAPPCIYCSADSEMRKQQRWETSLALQVNTRRALLQNPSTSISTFEDAVRARLTSKSMIKQFGHNEFILGK